MVRLFVVVVRVGLNEGVELPAEIKVLELADGSVLENPPTIMLEGDAAAVVVEITSVLDELPISTLDEGPIATLDGDTAAVVVKAP